MRSAPRPTRPGGSTLYRLTLEGVVQGVGFRPFVKRLADRFGFAGRAFNTGSGLIVEFHTPDAPAAHRFLASLRDEAPPASRIEHCGLEELAETTSGNGFHILASAARDRSFTLISADLASCPACLIDIRDPANRRFAYPFTNCVDCGPRYSITLSIPYDRVNTTMRRFPLCADCAREYADPADRRFHAEPIACPVCGPRLSLDLPAIRTAFVEGCIIAIKSLGGFQLACDAFSASALDRLRIVKRRSRKPFAVMMRDLATVRQFCAVSPAAARALASPAAPIVLLPVTNPGAFPHALAPGLAELGVMLPYTALHHLLFHDPLQCLVMTSGNVSEEPIVIGNEEARQKLSAIADLVVTHDRDIFMRVDDSVLRVFEDCPRVLRRARGFAPEAIRLHLDAPEVLASGGELKNAFCITKGRYAILSQHIGDLENFETLQFFEESLRNLSNVYRSQPCLIAHDLHPDYLGTRWALQRPEPKLAVQHHHAHIASCMAENGVRGPVIGVAFDGAGLGSDDQVWGGEVFTGDYTRFERIAHLRYVPLPGGDRAAREPWRMAAAHLHDAFGPEYRALPLPCWKAAAPPAWKILDRLMARPTLLTSSAGRLFDAIAAITGISQESSYEGESAMLLEAAAALDPSEDTYPIDLHTTTTPWILDPRPLVAAIAQAIAGGAPPRRVARCFHNSVARMIDVVCSAVRERSGLNQVCLSGGTFQNLTLLARAVPLLRRSRFTVYLHSQVPPNDGGLALGQAVIAAHSLSQEPLDVSRHTR